MGRYLLYAVIAFLAYMAYKSVKKRLGSSDSNRQRVNPTPARDEVIDVMVPDPNCGTYVPRHEAISARVGGEEMYFCSTKCRDAYLAKRAQGGE